MRTHRETCQQGRCEGAVRFEARRSQRGELERFCLRCFWSEMMETPLWGAQQWMEGRRKPLPAFKTWEPRGAGATLEQVEVIVRRDFEGGVREVEVW